MVKKANFLQALLAAGALMLPGGCARVISTPDAAKEARLDTSTWEIQQGKDKVHLTRLEEAPSQLIERLFHEGHNVVFLPEFDHREVAVLEAISKHSSAGTALICEMKTRQEFLEALDKYKAGEKEPLIKLLNDPDDYHAPDESRKEARERYFKAKTKTFTDALDKGVMVVPIDLPSDFPEAIAATQAANEQTAFSCAAHLMLALKKDGMSLKEMKENRRHRNHAEQFVFGELLNPEESKKLAEVLGIENNNKLKDIREAIGNMDEASFGRFKEVLHSHLSRVTGKGEVINGDDTRAIKDVLQKGIYDFADKTEKAEAARDVIREAKMTERFVEVFRQQVKEGKTPRILVTGGRGHVEHTPDAPGGRKDLDEMIVEKEPAIKPAVVCFVPIKPEKMEDLPQKEGAAVFYAGKQWLGADHVCLVAAENLFAVCKITPAPEVAPNHAELTKSEKFREQQQKIAVTGR